MPKLQSDLLTPAVQSLTANFLMAAKMPNRELLLAGQEMLEQDPVTRMAVQAINLYVLSALQEYTHPRATAQRYIRGCIANCKGSWRNRLKMANSYLYWGYSFTELAMPIDERNRATLGDMRTLPPLLYRFEGVSGELTQIRYRGLIGDILIPYPNGMHLVSGEELSFNPVTGSSMLTAALPYWQLHKVLMPVLAIAAQRQATPILVQQTETGADVALLNSDGTLMIGSDDQPVLINKGFDVVSKLAALGSAGVTAIDRDDTLYQIEPKIAADFLGSIVELCKQLRMQCYLLPPTPFGYSQSGVGDSGLADVQLAHFRAITASWAQDLGEAIVESIARPLLQHRYNFGNDADWGRFPVAIDNPQSLEIAKIISDAVARGSFSRNDIAAINTMRAALGIDDWESEEALLENWAIAANDSQMD